MGGGAPACPTAGIKPAVGSSHRPLARPGGYILEAQPLTTARLCFIATNTSEELFTFTWGGHCNSTRHGHLAPRRNLEGPSNRRTSVVWVA